MARATSLSPCLLHGWSVGHMHVRVRVPMSVLGARMPSMQMHVFAHVRQHHFIISLSQTVRWGHNAHVKLVLIAASRHPRECGGPASGLELFQVRALPPASSCHCSLVLVIAACKLILALTLLMHMSFSVHASTPCVLSCTLPACMLQVDKRICRADPSQAGPCAMPDKQWRRVSGPAQLHRGGL